QIIAQNYAVRNEYLSFDPVSRDAMHRISADRVNGQIFVAHGVILCDDLCRRGMPRLYFIRDASRLCNAA
ncbi:MAG: hypothetical protein LBL04_17500, partial [Bacteroidales bacterium]|nr:hypothetical protein [Bacteroidales bacterium]